MTTIPAGAHVSVGQSRRARREVAAHHVGDACSSDVVRVPRVVILLGVALLALVVMDVVLALVELM